MTEILIAFFSLVAGGILSYWITVRHNPVKSLHHFTKEFDLVDKQKLGIGSELKIDFLEKPVEQMGLCRVFIWNSGSVCVQGSEIARKDRIRILVPSANAVSLVSANPSRGAIDFSAEVGSNEIELKFDILDSGDWVDLRFIYDGGFAPKGNASARPILSGSIAGIPNGIAYLDLEDNVTESHWTRKLMALMILFVPASMAISAYTSFAMGSLVDATGTAVTAVTSILPWVFVVLTAFTFLASAGYLYNRWRSVRIKIPSGIRKALINESGK